MIARVARQLCAPKCFAGCFLRRSERTLCVKDGCRTRLRLVPRWPQLMLQRTIRTCPLPTVHVREEARIAVVPRSQDVVQDAGTLSSATQSIEPAPAVEGSR